MLFGENAIAWYGAMKISSESSPLLMQQDSFSLDGFRRRLLADALPHAGEAGWTAAWERVVEAHDPDLAAIACPDGARDLALFFLAEGNRRMLDAMASLDPPPTRIRDKIRAAVRARLEVDAPHRAAMRNAFTLLAGRAAPAAAIGNLYACCDAIWRGIGDTSQDFNFYTKRGILSLVLASTTLFWLNDDSDGQEATWRFLDRRIDNVMAFEACKAKAREWKKDASPLEDFLAALGRFRYAGDREPTNANPS